VCATRPPRILLTRAPTIDPVKPRKHVYVLYC
jgi:hypothetical protein